MPATSNDPDPMPLKAIADAAEKGLDPRGSFNRHGTVISIARQKFRQ